MPAATHPPEANGASESDVALAVDTVPHQPHLSRGLHVRCPHCSNPMEILADSPYDDVTCRTCGSTFNLVERRGTGRRCARRSVASGDLI